MNQIESLISLTTAVLPCLALSAMSPSARAHAVSARRHGINEICAGEHFTWVKVLECDGFIEGINFDDQGRL